MDADAAMEKVFSSHARSRNLTDYLIAFIDVVYEFFVYPHVAYGSFFVYSMIR
jgi:hypothetical protein